MGKGGRSKAAKKKLDIGRDRTRARRYEQGTITLNMAEIIKIAEGRWPGSITEPTVLDGEVPRVTKAEVQEALNGTKKGKAAGDDGITNNF